MKARRRYRPAPASPRQRSAPVPRPLRFADSKLLKAPRGGQRTPHQHAETVLSENNLFQHLEVLKRNREKRHSHKEFIVEGVSAINLGLEHGWEFTSIVHRLDVQLSRWANGVINANPGVKRVQIAPALFSKLSERHEGSELLVTVRMKPNRLDRIVPTADGVLLVFDRPGSPGNLGTSIRSADAFGARGVIVTGHAVDIYDPLVVRSSVGTLFSTPVVQAPSHAAVVGWVEEAKRLGFLYQIVGTSGKGRTPISAHALTSPTVIVCGNESTGMSRAYWDICDVVTTIPIRGARSSLNVGCAAAIALYEVSRQRGGG